LSKTERILARNWRYLPNLPNWRETGENEEEEKVFGKSEGLFILGNIYIIHI
jgi:hypothetical protein